MENITHSLDFKWTIILIIVLSYTFIFNKTHIMNSLVLLECLTILVIIMMFIFTSKMKMENAAIIYFIIISLSESIMGITIMVSLIRTHSNDYLMTLSPNKF